MRTVKIKKRDANILASFKREIDLRGRVMPAKNKYSRKIKHKGKQ